MNVDTYDLSSETKSNNFQGTAIQLEDKQSSAVTEELQKQDQGQGSKEALSNK